MAFESKRGVGVFAAERVVTGAVEGDRIAGGLRAFPDADDGDVLNGMPAERIAACIREQVMGAAAGRVHAVGLALPGIVRNGVVEDSPNLPQLKGQNMSALLEGELRGAGVDAPVTVFNDADAVAAGLAASRGQLDRVVRVWTLGVGIGYGRYPYAEGVWEGGHTTVTLDPKEQYCGCGGVGHLEGIVGHRAMRLRFLDMEPDEVFAAARQGDARCADFTRLWHRALAAATATSIHLEGPGRFYFTGFNTRFLDLPLLNHLLQEMVKMSPLQGYTLEIVPSGHELAVLGAGVNAMQAMQALSAA